jgi:uncharacterized protein (TIGR03067 family)
MRIANIVANKSRPAAILIAGILLATVPSCGLDAKSSDPQADAKDIQGEWHAVYAEQDGDPIPPQAGSITYTFSDGKYVTKVDGDEIVASRGGSRGNTYKLDASKSPREIDLETAGGTTTRGIYRLRGGELTLCTATGEGNQARPTEFKTSKGSNALLMKLERVKK